MRLWFCRSNTPVGLLIQLVTFCRWNHVAIEINGTVYEADMLGGVRALPVAQFRRMWAETVAKEIEVVDRLSAFRFLQDQLGKPYDRMAILAMPFDRDWQDPEKWFCSELAAGFLVNGGHQSFFMEKYRIWPRDLWTVAPWLNESPCTSA